MQSLYFIRLQWDETDEDGQPLFWSNADGWVDFISANAWTDKNVNLPIGGEWVEYPVRYLTFTAAYSVFGTDNGIAYRFVASYDLSFVYAEVVEFSIGGKDFVDESDLEDISEDEWERVPSHRWNEAVTVVNELIKTTDEPVAYFGAEELPSWVEQTEGAVL